VLSFPSLKFEIFASIPNWFLGATGLPSPSSFNGIPLLSDIYHNAAVAFSSKSHTSTHAADINHTNAAELSSNVAHNCPSITNCSLIDDSICSFTSSSLNFRFSFKLLIVSASAHSICAFLNVRAAFDCFSAALINELTSHCCFNIDSLFAELLPPPLNELSLCVVSITLCPASFILAFSLAKSSQNISSALLKALFASLCI